MSLKLINYPMPPHATTAAIFNRSKRTRMRDTGCTSFFDVGGCLFCIILCFAMVLLELWIVSVTGLRAAPVPVWPLMVALLMVIGWPGLEAGADMASGYGACQNARFFTSLIPENGEDQ